MKFHFRNILACLGLLLLTNSMVQAQRPYAIGTWTPYLSYEYIKDIILDDELFYFNTKGGFFTWDPVSMEVKTYSPIDGLSDVDASAMYIDSASNTVFLGYEDGTINYFQKPFSTPRFMTDIQRTDLFTSKRINDFEARDGLLYIATEFGVVVFDIDKEETRSSITKVSDNPSGTPVNDLMIVDDTIYLCLGSAGLYYTYIDQPNITLPSVWEKADDGTKGMSPGEADHLAHIGSIIYAMVGDTCYTKYAGQNWIRGPLPHTDKSFFMAIDSQLYCDDGNFIRVHPLDTNQYLLLPDQKPTTAYIDSNYILWGDPGSTLQWMIEEDSLVELGPDGPQINIITELGVGKGQIYIAPRGQSGATSAPLNKSEGFYHYTMGKGWQNFNVEDELSRDSIFEDFARLHFNPNDSVCYVGSWGQGVIAVKNGEILANYTSENSGLTASFNQQQGTESRVSGLDMDSDENLWITAILGDFNLNVKTPEDEWYNYNLSSTFPVDIMVDDWGNKWVINNQLGLVVFNENGTLDNTADDQVKRLNTSQGQGGLPNNTVNALAKDRNGHIWIGTLEGIAVFANPSRVFQSNFPDASCPVIDGFCLLRDQEVTTIAVDGNNRKWIGTTNGIYLVNPQGNRLIEHYTTENSPLFTNEIRDIAIDPETGEIFIGTGQGLLSFMGEAIEGKETSEDLYVFPNPFYTDYDGQIAITCGVTDAEVRITTVSGHLVRELDATGGQAVWDGLDTAGNKLRPGIYLAMVADVDGKNAGIAKFAVIARD